MSIQKIPNLDKIDWQIIDALVEQPDLNMAQLSEKLDIPKTTVYNRFDKLKEEKIISKGIKVDKNFLFGEIVTFILIKILLTKL